MMTHNAIRNVGLNDAWVAKKIKLPHVRKIIFVWLTNARGALLHKAK